MLCIIIITILYCAKFGTYKSTYMYMYMFKKRGKRHQKNLKDLYKLTSLSSITQKSICMGINGFLDIYWHVPYFSDIFPIHILPDPRGHLQM